MALYSIQPLSPLLSQYVSSLVMNLHQPLPHPLSGLPCPRFTDLLSPLLQSEYFTKLHFSEKAIGAAVSTLGIHNKDEVIVYDRKGMFSVACVWWMFRVFRHDKVWVLDGGLPKWHSSGNDVESSASGEAILKASAASEAIEWGG